MCETARVERADKTPHAVRRFAEDLSLPRGSQSGRRAEKSVDGNSSFKPFRRQEARSEKGAPGGRHGQQGPGGGNSPPQKLMPQMKTSCRAVGLQSPGQPPDPVSAPKPLVGRPCLTIREAKACLDDQCRTAFLDEDRRWAFQRELRRFDGSFDLVWLKIGHGDGSIVPPTNVSKWPLTSCRRREHLAPRRSLVQAPVFNGGHVVIQ